MVAENSYYQVLSDTVTGSRAVDEESFSAVAVLGERLETLKRASSMFVGVSFSPEVEELASCEMVSVLS
jgi:hypothetical protein